MWVGRSEERWGEVRRGGKRMGEKWEEGKERRNGGVGSREKRGETVNMVRGRIGSVEWGVGRNGEWGMYPYPPPSFHTTLFIHDTSLLLLVLSDLWRLV